MQTNQVSAENEMLKKSILSFRNELEKKQNQLYQAKGVSNSVGNLQSVFHDSSDKITQEFQNQIIQLQKELFYQTNLNKQQEEKIKKYEQRWEKLQEEARKKRNKSTSLEEMSSSSTT